MIESAWDSRAKQPVSNARRPPPLPPDVAAATVRAENDQLFQLMIANVRDYAIFMLTPSGHVATWNLGAERIKGYRAEEIIGKHFSTFYPAIDVDGGNCGLEPSTIVDLSGDAPRLLRAGKGDPRPFQ